MNPALAAKIPLAPLCKETVSQILFHRPGFRGDPAEGGTESAGINQQ
jgi:hypothetical protein